MEQQELLLQQNDRLVKEIEERDASHSKEVASNAGDYELHIEGLCQQREAILARLSDKENARRRDAEAEQTCRA